MWYEVFRQLPNGHFVLIAKARYLEDALAMYANWHSAKIMRGDQLIDQKNART